MYVGSDDLAMAHPLLIHDLGYLILERLRHAGVVHSSKHAHNIPDGWAEAFEDAAALVIEEYVKRAIRTPRDN